MRKQKTTPVRRRAAKPAAAARSRGDRMTLRELNRALLARQMLLERAPLAVGAAVRRLAGPQAQLPRPPYLGLWSRLVSVAREDIASRIEGREIVRVPAMRGTLHLMTAEDYIDFRAPLQPMLARAFEGMPAARRKGIVPETVAAEARGFLRDGPRTMEEIRTFLTARHPSADARIMGYATRLFLPLVQVPDQDRGSWGFPTEPAFALAESWIGQPLARTTDPTPLVRRYLAAFGPAGARDVQTWSGLQGLRDVLEALRPQLRVYTDEKGRELFDLPEAERPDGDTPAPPRFLPEYDNILLAHADRTRIVPEAYRSRVFLPGLRVAATFLIDGFVHGTWKVERKKGAATLVIEPFAKLAKADREALVEEAERLVRFVEPDAGTWAARVTK